MGFLDSLLRGFRWYRRWRGGYWEEWWIEVTHSAIWFHNEYFTERGERPPCGRGGGYVEDYR